MDTYSLIVKNVIKPETNFLQTNYKPDGVDGTFKILFGLFLNDTVINVKNKIIFFEKTLQHFLIKNKREDEFTSYFCKIQRIYNMLNKLVYNYKYKKSKIVVNTDMCLNELVENSKNVICIFNNNSKYLFHIKDLIKIINSALTNSHMFFSEPISIKNPYDNVPFTKSTLYNIYFFIKYKTDYYPELFFKFFDVNFNLTNFMEKNQHLLRSYIIKDYVYKSPSKDLLHEIKKMISHFNSYCSVSKLRNKIVIDNDFPKDKLIKIMRPYLMLYILSQYAISAQEQKDAETLLRKKLVIFNRYNPRFGRKTYRIIIKNIGTFQKKICGKIIEFNDKHIKFNEIEKQNANFLSDHLTYTETNNLPDIMSEEVNLNSNLLYDNSEDYYNSEDYINYGDTLEYPGSDYGDEDSNSEDSDNDEDEASLDDGDYDSYDDESNNDN
jgi:hypothetical protein